MTIPEIRIELLERMIMDEKRGHVALARHLGQLVMELYRREPVTRAPRKRKTPPRPVVLKTVAENPGLDQMGVAALLGTNGGRISEHLRGKRP